MEIGSDTINTVRRNCYVDGFSISVESCEEAIRMYGELKQLVSLGSFNPTKCISNKHEVMNAIPESELSIQLKKIDYQKDTLPVERRALAVHWNIETNEFQYNVYTIEKPPTTRGLLSVISSTYDSLAMTAPFILSVKFNFERLCQKRIRWEDEISKREVKNWRSGTVS